MLHLASLVALLAVSPFPAFAATAPEAAPDRYICPNKAGNTAVDCYLNAVDHLYTMCQHVKSIEIIEFGYEKADEGVNGAKSQYCINKQKQSMTKPYKAAQREAKNNRAATDALRELNETWLKALAGLKWQPPESDAEYKDRTAKPHDIFRERAEGVRVALAGSGSKGATKQAPKAGGAAAKGSAN